MHARDCLHRFGRRSFRGQRTSVGCLDEAQPILPEGASIRLIDITGGEILERSDG